MKEIKAPAHPYIPGAAIGPPTLLLLWDAPNLDMGLGSILGAKPLPSYRPRFDALGRWLIDRSSDLSEELDEYIEPEATVFTNVAESGAESIRSWVDALRNIGFAVFAKPKSDTDSDVDSNMIAHIRRRQHEEVLRGVVVASADGRNFQEILSELAATGIPVTVVGFHEHASWAIADPAIDFIDLENIPGVFREPLPRVNLDNLPAEGAWLQPFRPLSALVNH
ncbi:NYN domain-containing protein [Corynebacterium caspium]|uniref:NYN domain-containing protein n=1 Tax=Corynebacterium caspium TaxID=234828 RepID=UPI00036687F9|nr:NYN domain-containing protein [Corynebacterium caspium]WKD59966.1 NYN domain protein [Corynebacterium caspium DSM 44850]